MTDEYAIQQVLNTYSEAASRADWDTVMGTFIADGIWSIPDVGAHFEGAAQIRDGLRQFSDPMDYIVQLNAPALIAIDGDTATTRTVIRECGKYSGRDEALEILGYYSDNLVRTAEGWRFAKRLFTVQGMHTYPLNPAPAAG